MVSAWLAGRRFHLLHEDLLLPLGLLELGVLLRIDLREAVLLLALGADLFFKLVAFSPFGPQGFGEAPVVGGGSGSIGRRRPGCRWRRERR